jgi:hypothetical protein
MRVTAALAPALLAVVCGCQKQEQKSEEKPALVSAEKTSFDAVTSKLDKGGNFYLYLSTEQALGGLSAKLDSLSNFLGGLPTGHDEEIGKAFDFAKSLLKDSGIEQISGVGMSSIAREPGFYYSKLVVHHYPGQGDGLIWSVMGKASHPLTDLDLLPESTVLASFADLDVPLLWTNIKTHLQQLGVPQVSDGLAAFPGQFLGLTGLDFDAALASLGGDYGFLITMDEQKKVSLPLPGAAMEIPSPAIAIIAKVKSDLIFNRVDELTKDNAMVVRVNTPELKMRTMNIPLPLPIELRPSIARSGDLLVLSSSDTLVHEILDVKAGKKKSFKTTAEFARLSQGIPGEGNSFSIVADRFMKSILEIQQQTLTNQGKLTPAQVQAMQHMFNNATNYGAYSVGANGSEGWEGYANGSQSIQAAMAGGAFAAGALAAIAIPNFTRARATSQENACINNLRLIDSAKQRWALEKNKTSTDTPTMSDLLPYLNKAPVCPKGGAYTIGPVGEKPTCSVPGHVLP